MPLKVGKRKIEYVINMKEKIIVNVTVKDSAFEKREASTDDVSSSLGLLCVNMIISMRHRHKGKLKIRIRPLSPYEINLADSTHRRHNPLSSTAKVQSPRLYAIMEEKSDARLAAGVANGRAFQ